MPRETRRQPLWPALYVLVFFVAVGLVTWRIDGAPGQLLFFVLIGIFVGSGFLVHARARPFRKKWGRTLSVTLVGSSLLLGAGVFGRQSFQIEGFFFYALAGIAGGVVVHYLVAKIAGPLLIGRAWCGWGCWIWMVLRLLPWKRSPGRRAGWGRVRTLHFVLSLGLVASLAALGYDHGFAWASTDGRWWFAGGCGLYYGAGALLAAALRDDRAFCKYACPVTVFLRLGTRASVLKVAADPTACDDCGACEKACPMDVRVMSFVHAGTRVLDLECTLCQTCVGACPRGALRLSLGLDVSRGPVLPA